MPNFDGTGPQGAGPGTGRGIGPCGGGCARGFRGYGRGRGFGRGLGLARGYGYGYRGYAATKDEEKEIVEQTTSAYIPKLENVLTGKDILRLQEIVRRVPIAKDVVDYAVSLARSSRPTDDNTAPKDLKEFIRNYVSWGAGLRASQYLTLGAKARAIMQGRYHATCDDIRAVAKPVLRHRILTNFNAEADGITSLDIIDRLLEEIREPGS